MFKTLNTIQDFELEINTSQAVLIYFSHEECNVCKVLKPKIETLLKTRFPEMELCYVNVRNNPDIAGQNTIFAVPTIMVFIEQKEVLKFSRNFGLSELEQKIQKPYALTFD